MRYATILLVGLSLGASCTSCDPPTDKPDPCTAGTAGCACDDTRCDSGLACNDGVCRAVLTTGLKIADARARSCEALLTETTAGALADVVFSGAVTGRVVREGNRAAVAFHANTDATIGDDAVTIAVTGQVDQIAQALTLSSTRCFDAAGAPLSGSGLSF